MAKTRALSAKEIDGTIVKNLGKLRKPGVLTVRPGFEITGDQLTGRQAIVATVEAKKSKAALAKSAILPDKIGRYPVDVREASPYQRLNAADPAAAALAEAYGRPENRDPSWPDERELSTGKRMTDATSHTQRMMRKAETLQPATHRALTAHAGKKDNQVDYAPPKGEAPLSNRSKSRRQSLRMSARMPGLRRYRSSLPKRRRRSRSECMTSRRVRY
jgi:hypothetical protein